MCDIAAEKQKIDALLEDAARKNPMRDCADERLLTELALRALREHYEDTCPDECLRRRCAEFAERLLRRRAVERWRRRLGGAACARARDHPKACARSAMRSSGCSMPIDTRIGAS